MQYICNRTVVPIRSSSTSSKVAALPSIAAPGTWTRKTLGTAPSLTDQSFPKPLGSMLRGRNLAKLEKNEAAHMSYLRAQLGNHKLDDLKVG